MDIWYPCKQYPHIWIHVQLRGDAAKTTSNVRLRETISNLCKRISSCAIAYLFKMHLVLAREYIEKRRIEVDG